MKLYYSPGACSLSPHIVANEAGIPLDLVKVDTKSKTIAREGDFWAVNAKGLPRHSDFGDNTGGVIAKIACGCHGHRLAGVLREATEMGLGERPRFCGELFGWHNIQRKTLWSPAGIDPPLDAKGFCQWGAKPQIREFM